ncbi:MAG: HAD family phosphatase [Opitutales bacterium]
MPGSLTDWAALFDWDGVIINSARAHERSWERLAEELNRPLPADHFLRGFGMRNEVIFPEIQDMVTSEDVSHGKPDPEVFLKAAERAGLPPGQCVVFEDALYGIQAAKAAGMSAIGVLTTHPGGFLKGADRLVARLDELPLDGSHPLN